MLNARKKADTLCCKLIPKYPVVIVEKENHN